MRGRRQQYWVPSRWLGAQAARRSVWRGLYLIPSSLLVGGSCCCSDDTIGVYAGCLVIGVMRSVILVSFMLVVVVDGGVR